MKQADRFNSGKPKLSYVLEAEKALTHAANVFEYGAKKYSRGNWKKGLPTTEVIDSMLRHIAKYLGGEDLDAESGLPHVGHILDNAIFLAEFYGDKQWDDRAVATPGVPTVSDKPDVPEGAEYKYVKTYYKLVYGWPFYYIPIGASWKESGLTRDKFQDLIRRGLAVPIK